MATKTTCGAADSSNERKCRNICSENSLKTLDNTSDNTRSENDGDGVCSLDEVEGVVSVENLTVMSPTEETCCEANSKQKSEKISALKSELNGMNIQNSLMKIQLDEGKQNEIRLNQTLSNLVADYETRAKEGEKNEENDALQERICLLENQLQAVKEENRNLILQMEKKNDINQVLREKLHDFKDDQKRFRRETHEKEDRMQENNNTLTLENEKLNITLNEYKDRENNFRREAEEKQKTLTQEKAGLTRELNVIKNEDEHLKVQLAVAGAEIGNLRESKQRIRRQFMEYVLRQLDTEQPAQVGGALHLAPEAVDIVALQVLCVHVPD